MQLFQKEEQKTILKIALLLCVVILLVFCKASEKGKKLINKNLTSIQIEQMKDKVTPSKNKKAKLFSVDFKFLIPSRVSNLIGFYFLGVTPDKRRIVEVTESGVVKVWDIETKNLINKFFLNINKTRFVSIKIMKNGKKLLLAFSDGEIFEWALNTGKLLKRFGGYAYGFSGLEITPNEEYAITWGTKGVIIWDIATGKLVKQFDGYKKARVFSNNKLILWGQKDKEIDIVELTTGKLLTKINTKLSVIAFLKTVPESNKIILAQNRKIEVWDIEGKRLLYDKNEEDLISGMFDLSEIQDIAVTPDGKNLILLFNYVIKVFDLVNGDLLKTINLGFDYFSFSFSIIQLINSSTLILLDVSDILKILVIDLNKGKIIKQLVGKNHFPRKNFISSEVCYLGSNKLAIMNDYSLGVYDIKKRELTLLDGSRDNAYSVAFSRTGKRVVLLTEDYLKSVIKNKDKFFDIVKVWDLEEGKIIKSLQCKNVSSVSITPDGQEIIMGYLNGMLARLNLKDNKFTKIKNAHNSAIQCLAVTEDGQKIVSGDEDGKINIWNLNNLKLIKEIKGTNSKILCLDTTGNEEKLIAGDISGVISIWNLNSGKLIKKLKEVGSVINCLAITPDGKKIIAGTNKANLYVWDIEKGTLLKTVKFKRADKLVAIEGISITSDGKKAVIAVDRWFEKGFDFKRESDFVLYDLKSYRQLKSIKVADLVGNSVIDVKIIPDKNKFISFEGDKGIFIRDLYSGKTLYEFVNFLDGEWVAISNKGYYTCSPNGEKYLFIKINNKIYDITLFHDVLWKKRLSANL